VAATYSARIVTMPDGVRLQPVNPTNVPDNPYDVNLLALAVALSMGAAGYQHHPEPRDPQLDLDELLQGTVTMPWIAPSTGEPLIVCERTSEGTWHCDLQDDSPL